jgi:hypothetical protein
MMLLALLTIISIAASNTARTEVQIAANDLIYQRNFYLAEGAVIEAVDQLQNDANPRDLAFVVPGLKAIDDSTYMDYWDADPEPGARKVTASLDDSQKTRYVGGYEGTPTGYSLGMDKPRVHAFAVYGRTEKQGVTAIKVGFLKAY